MEKSMIALALGALSIANVHAGDRVDPYTFCADVSEYTINTTAEAIIQKINGASQRELISRFVINPEVEVANPVTKMQFANESVRNNIRFAFTMPENTDWMDYIYRSGDVAMSVCMERMR